ALVPKVLIGLNSILSDSLPNRSIHHHDRGTNRAMLLYQKETTEKAIHFMQSKISTTPPC
ncbi:MAG TPA: hypothetical protein VJ044_10035, partial [Candidatus Hodarchaeales archaeon]|nr:hypothetical protein [Candidatus Hodarchaeales archaeon]